MKSQLVFDLRQLRSVEVPVSFSNGRDHSIVCDAGRGYGVLYREDFHACNRCLLRQVDAAVDVRRPRMLVSLTDRRSVTGGMA
jgi:hypothetical protein